MSSYVDEMTARGWQWQPNLKRFRVSGFTIYATVQEETDGWFASYGTQGCDFSTCEPHSTPMLAADEAEKWLHRAVRGLPGVVVPP